MTYVNDKKAQFFGSQGQQRTIVLSLKLAEIELIKQARGEYPVLLLDDVLSELDDDRQHILMSYIKDKVQTILTTATIKGLKLHQLPHAEIFYISAGNISKGEHYDGTKASTPTVWCGSDSGLRRFRSRSQASRYVYRVYLDCWFTPFSLGNCG